MKEEVILSAKKICKTFYTPNPTDVLTDLDLVINRGESLSIMGPSGVGKSTLIHVLGTLETPTSGSLEILGKDIRSYSTYKLRNRHIGFIFQSFHLLEEYTALENVLFPARILRKNTRKGSPSYNHATGLLEELGLTDRLNFPTKLLSGGEKQRIALARALCNDPDLLFADEPSGNLDQENSKYIHDLLLSLVKKYKKTLIVVTHDQNLASLCDRTLFLEKGRLIHN